MAANPMLSLVDVMTWVVMVPQNLYASAADFIGLVMRAARGMCLDMKDPHVVNMPDDKQATYVNQLEDLLSNHNPQLVVCIVSNNRGDRYSAIKKKCSVDRAGVCNKSIKQELDKYPNILSPLLFSFLYTVASQVITSRCLTNKNAQSIALKIAVQINCKLGGAPWTVDIPMKGTMIVGFDVTTDTLSKNLSYGALVATLDSKLSKYFSAVTAHKNPEEASNNVADNVLRALHKFKSHNGGNLPARIIVYRDGVGDGQIPYILKHEVTLLQVRPHGNIYNITNFELVF